MAAPTVFRWSDTGAPTLDNTAGSLINVLDFCLPSRGWVKEFSGTGKAAYRAGSGNRKYYRVLDDNSVLGISYFNAVVTGYDSMTDVDTGAGWGQSTYIRKTYNDALAKRWVIVVDEKGFYLITQPHGGTGVDISLRACVVHYFGETVPLMPGHTSRDVLAGCCLTGQYNGSLAHADSTYNGEGYIRCNSSLDGASSSLNLYMTASPFYTGQSTQNPVGNFVNCLYTYPYNGELIYGKPRLWDASSANTIGDYLPFFYYTPQKGGGFTNLATYSSDGLEILAVYVSSSSTGISLSSNVTVSVYAGLVLISLNESR